MKKGQKVLLIFNAILIVVLTVDCFIGILNVYTNVLFLVVLFLLLKWRFGFENTEKNYTKDVVLTILIYALLYYVLTNLSGLFLGFLRTSYSLKILSIVKNIIPVLISIFLAELVRHILISKGKKYKEVVVLSIIVLTLFDVNLLAHAFNFSVFESGLMFVLKYLLPAIAKNVLLTYLVFNSGYKTSILYRLLIEIPVYLLPIFPNFGEYVDVVVQVLLPLILMYILYLNYTKKKKIFYKKSTRVIVGSIVAIFCLVQIILTTGWFKYFSLTVGSGSMTPNLLVGDVIIVEKVADPKNIEVGEILVYRHEKVVVVHRVIMIKEDNGKLTFYTQGDNNDGPDSYSTSEDNVMGITKIRIPYLGYPVVWLDHKINDK